ncbi:MAG: hypothetical protein DRO67_01200 [Candidatus Asgardarchaeum californiense]|nr:MAG: hypothetical protein DRO67_01200 [Candidatus Asgardarchaeum californiense]
MKTLLVNEGTSTIQLVCPYCEQVQIESTALHVLHIPVDFWKCEYCEKIGKGNGNANDLSLCEIPEAGAIYIPKKQKPKIINSLKKLIKLILPN